MTQRRRFLAPLLAFLLFAAGCGGGGKTDPGATKFATVLGIVKDSLLGDRGVSGATIALGAASGATTTTDQAAASGGTLEVGQFTLKNVPVGTSAAKVTLPGGEVQTVAFYPPIGAGTNADIEIIVNIGQVRGTILGADGKPVRDASIFLTADGPTDSVSSLADGSFLIQNVQPGSAELAAIFGTKSATRALTVGKGVTDVGSITLLDDPNPDPPGSPKTLFGTVALAPGGEKAAGTVLILFRNGVQYETATTGANGVYKFYVPIGAYTLRATRDSYLDQETSVAIVDANKPVQTDFTLQPR